MVYDQALRVDQYNSINLIFTETGVLEKQWLMGRTGCYWWRKTEKSPSWWQPRGGDVPTFLHQPQLALFSSQCSSLCLLPCIWRDFPGNM